VQTTDELVCPKGQIMANYEAGLHKDVLTIFEGVWIPHIDNVQQTISAPVATSAAIAHPKPLVPDHWILPDATVTKKHRIPKRTRSYRSSRFSGITNAIRQFPGQILKSKTKQEKKRLESISKHLLINLPS
jgi:hypothetical protein